MNTGRLFPATGKVVGSCAFCGETRACRLFKSSGGAELILCAECSDGANTAQPRKASYLFDESVPRPFR